MSKSEKHVSINNQHSYILCIDKDSQKGMRKADINRSEYDLGLEDSIEFVKNEEILLVFNSLGDFIQETERINKRRTRKDIRILVYLFTDDRNISWAKSQLLPAIRLIKKRAPLSISILIESRVGLQVGKGVAQIRKIDRENSPVKYKIKEMKKINKNYGFQENKMTSFSEKNLKLWNFNAWSYSLDELCYMVEEIFQNIGVYKAFEETKDSFREFLYDILDRYNPNPFHSIRHAVDSLQILYSLLMKHDEIRKRLTSLDIASLSLALMVHDVGHTGIRLNCYTEGDIIRQGRMEEYHMLLLWEIINRHPNIKILKKIEMDVMDLVMETKLDYYSRSIKELEDRASELSINELGNKETDRKLIMNSLIKICDIGNIMRPYSISSVWDEAFAAELYGQGNSMGISYNFINNYGEPYHKALTKIFPCLKKYSSLICKNKERNRKLL